MTKSVTTGHLPVNRLEQAWPLVREIAGAVSLESWCMFARAMVSPVDPETTRRGILIAERRRTIRGLVTYETVPDLSRGCVLLLRNAVVLDLSMNEAIALALHRRSHEVAVETKCDSLCLELTPKMAWIGDVWARHTAEKDSLPMSFVRVSDVHAPSVVDTDKVVRVHGG